MWTSKLWFGFNQTDITESSAYKLLEVADPHEHAKTLSGREDMKGQIFHVIKSGDKQYISIYPHHNIIASYVNGRKIESNA